MKTISTKLDRYRFLPLAAAFLTLTIAIRAHAEEVKENSPSLAGRWILKAREMGGKDLPLSKYEFYGIYRTGEEWNLVADGTGNCGGVPVRWDSGVNSKKLDIRFTNLLGFEVTGISQADYVIEGKRLSIFARQLGMKIDFRLERVVPVQIDDNNSSSSVQLSDEVVDREVFSETIETLPGLPKRITVRREYETTLHATSTVGAEVGGRAEVSPIGLAKLSAEAKAKMELALGIRLGRRDEVSESYELDGRSITKIRIRWVERFRKGRISLPGSQPTEFLVCVGLRTIPEKAL